ncbi:MAG TPA: ROK family protein [Verrucomicrobiae bacterium]|jgi:predicted NBD/HSP70 family sugar kinase|nr:ROK family protein [Verrucomicrobiae bacterium]
MVIIPSKMGRHNKRALLDRLLRLGTASRAGLAKSLGLSQPTVGKITNELIELGVFEEVDEAAQNGSEHVRMGRPGRMLRLTQTKSRFLGMQLGLAETYLTPLPLSVSGENEWLVRFRTPETPREWSQALREAAAQMPQKSFWGILVSVPGLVDERKAKILYSPNLRWTAGTAFSAAIRKVWSDPVILIQEERILALGHHSAHPGGEDFLLVDFGEGVGSAVLISGKLYAHPLPISGELGHTPVMGNQRKCGCGSIGCLETLASIRALLESFAAAHPKSRKTWAAFSESVAARGVEPWLAKTLDAMGAGIAGALNVLGLRRVVITGTVTELPSAVFSYLTEAINKGTLWARFGELKIEKAPRHRKAGLVAAGIDRLIVPDEAPETVVVSQI